MSDPQQPTPDPLELATVDRAIRINELEEEAKELGMSSHYVSDDCHPEVHEEFLRSMIRFESGPLTSHFEQLTSAGVSLPDPASLDDVTVHSKLWEVIEALAARDTFLCHTDHLSDRQLYEHLWADSFREEITVMPPGSGWTSHIDLIGSGSDEDLQIYLRYYDTEEERQRWAKDFPDLIIPPHEDLPFDRDRHLPGA